MSKVKSRVVVAGIFALSAMTLSAQAADQTSYRLKGVGTDLSNIMTDEYTDARFFAVDILKVDGTKLYTGLSNISNDNFKVISNNGATIEPDYEHDGTQNTLGLVTGFAGIKGELVYQSGSLDTESRNPDTVVVTVDHSDGTITKTTTQTTTTDSDKGRDNLSGTVAGRLGRFELAGRVYRDGTDEAIKTITINNVEKSGVKADNSAYSSIDKSTTTQLANNNINTATGVVLGVGLPLSKGRLALDLDLGPRNIKSIVNDEEDNVNKESKDYSYDYQGAGLGSNDLTEAKGFGVTIKGKYSLPLMLFGKSMNINSYGAYSSSNSDGTITMEREYTKAETTGSTTETTKYKQVQPGKNALNSNTLDLSTGSEVVLNPTTNLVFGIKYSHSNNKVTTNANYTDFTETTDYTKVVSGEVDKNSSYTRTSTMTGSYLDENITDNDQLIVPVGIETKLTKALTLRMGASAYLLNTTKSTGTTTITSGKNLDVIEYLDTDKVTVTDQDSTGESNKTVTYDYKNSTKTVFSTGLGYAVNENISFDIVGFGNLTQFNTWSLSANIKF